MHQHLLETAGHWEKVAKARRIGVSQEKLLKQIFLDANSSYCVNYENEKYGMYILLSSYLAPPFLLGISHL